MVDFTTFKERIPDSFWTHIKKYTFVPWSNFPASKSEFLKNLYDELCSGTYTPQPPRDYVVSNKHNAVARIVPSLQLQDYCIYYFCIASLEEYLAINRTGGTYGGYSLGGKIRESEIEEFSEYEEIPFSVSPFSYNRLAWVGAWRDFNKKAYIYSRTGEYTHFLKFDIANFYNTINLSILERKVRLACPKETSDIIDLLFFFLKYWNKQFLQYAEQTVSIPQDEVGDCSRILANFYLQDYDKHIYELCEKHNCCYMRYADDQILMSENSDKNERILFEASKELFKIGLNINSSKVDRFRSQEEWDYYWCFDLFNLLGDKNDTGNIQLAISKFLQLNKSQCRYDSVLSRILNRNLDDISFDLRIKFLSEVLSDEYILNSSDRIILRIFSLLDERSKSQFLGKLKLLADKALFNSYHYNLLRAKQKGLPIEFEQHLRSRIKALKL